MKPVNKEVTGQTPEEWEARLARAADDPAKLAEVLAALEHEMRQEHTWLHANPTPGRLFKAIFRFLGRDDDDLESLGLQLQTELHAECQLKNRYRSWLPGELTIDRLWPYIKDFPGEVLPDSDGLQFAGFLKFKGVSHGTKVQAYAFYVNQRFPGRDPANFHVSFEPRTGELVIERVYRMELSRQTIIGAASLSGSSSPARAVLIELVDEIVPTHNQIRLLVIDNAANIATRQKLIQIQTTTKEVSYTSIENAEVAHTPLGHLMQKLAIELGLSPGIFSYRVNPFGVLKIILPVIAANHTNEAASQASS